MNSSDPSFNNLTILGERMNTRVSPLVLSTRRAKLYEFLDLNLMLSQLISGKNSDKLAWSAVGGLASPSQE